MISTVSLLATPVNTLGGVDHTRETGSPASAGPGGPLVLVWRLVRHGRTTTLPGQFVQMHVGNPSVGVRSHIHVHSSTLQNLNL